MISGSQKFTFTSYVNCVKPLSDEQNILHPKLLSGEIATVSADVIMVTPTTKTVNETNGICGKLFVTNFRLSFIPCDTVYEQTSFQDNRFLRRNDVTLSNIDAIYQIIDKKKKKVLPQQEVNSKIDALFVICKNFRFFKFSFKAKDQGTLIASALARFAFPSRHDLSFAFYYNDIYFNTFKNDVTMFNTKNDWMCELKRCGATEWKVICADSIITTSIKTSANLQTVVKPYYIPKYFVIPKCFNEKEFFLSTNAFCDSRSAFWVYSYGPTCASLVRMGELKSCIKGRTIENITLEKIRNCDPNRKSLEFQNLSEQYLPTISDIRQSYLKLRELCTPDSFREFLMQDSKYCSSLDKCGWLKCVSTCLKFSLKMSEFLRLGTTVVLQETNAREMCCVISSITQILLDPYFRTLIGFQSLIQKEWVALEHRFSDRLGHTWKQENISGASGTSNSNTLVNNFITSSTSMDEESPLLLLFLDCIWQLLQQYPEEFQFSQIYLTTIWDSAFMPIFDTFQFNCGYDRDIAVMEKKLILRPVWNWDEQFDEKNKIFFFNPLYLNKPCYTKSSLKQLKTKTTIPLKNSETFFSSDVQNHNNSTIPCDRYLEPLCGVSDLRIWQQCYYRWIPILEVERGGFPQIDLLNRLLIYNISKLQKELELDSKDLISISSNKNTGKKDLDGNSVNRKPFKKSIGEKIKTNLMKSELEPNGKKDGLIIESVRNSVNQCSTDIPLVNSFFPFGIYNGNSSEINDILILNSEPFSDDMAVDLLISKKISK